MSVMNRVHELSGSAMSGRGSTAFEATKTPHTYLNDLLSVEPFTEVVFLMKYLRLPPLGFQRVVFEVENYRKTFQAATDDFSDMTDVVS